MRDGTIAPAKPNTEYEPWKSGGGNSYEMCLSCLFPNPSKKVKRNKYKMEKGEKYVEEFEQEKSKFKTKN